MRKKFKLSDIQNKEGFTRFWKLHKADFEKYVRFKLNKNDKEDAKDIIQTVVRKVWKYITTKDRTEKKDMYTFFLTCLDNGIKDFYTEKKKYRFNELDKKTSTQLFEYEELRTIRFNIGFQSILKKYLSKKHYYFFIVDKGLLNKTISCKELKPLEGKKIRDEHTKEFIELKDKLPSIYEDDSFYNSLRVKDIFKKMSETNIRTIRSRATKAIASIKKKIKEG